MSTKKQKLSLPDIDIKKCVLRYKKLEIPLLSGEFHYWRIPHENWEKIAEKIKLMGLEVVASYIPWNYHELKPGEYDFTGRTSPQRDLMKFIRILKKAGLYLIIRPGPYIYAEWPHGGPPERAVKHSWLSPQFMKMAKHYINHVCKILLPEQISRGGNIIMFQADNEPYPFLENFGDELGCFKEHGIFKEWLKDRYHENLDALNRAWKTKLTSFDEANFYFHEECTNTDLAMADRLLPASEYQIRYSDCADFVAWYAAKVVSTTTEWMRDAGINVPICANHWSSQYSNFDYFCKSVDLVGTDQYPIAFLDGKHPSGIKDNWFYNIDIIKMAEADVTHGNVWSAELQSGCSMCSGYLPANHFKYVIFTLMGRSLRGWNWYMLVNRDNWSRAPINEWGCTNSYFPIHQQTVSAACFIQPWKLTPLYDISLFAYKPHRVISPGNFEAVYNALEEANISYDYFNPLSKSAPSNKILLYAGDDWVEKKVADQLDQFVRNGGIMITFSRYPVRNEFKEPLACLPFVTPEGARPTLLPVNISHRGKSVDVISGGHNGNKVNFCYFSKVPGEPVTATLSTKTKEMLVDVKAVNAASFTMGYNVQHGQGRIIYLGCNPSPTILQMILKSLDAEQYVSQEEKDISSNVHRHDDGSLALFISNRSDRINNVRIKLNCQRLKINARSQYKTEDAVTHEVRFMKGAELLEMPISIGAHDAVILRISKVEKLVKK